MIRFSLLDGIIESKKCLKCSSKSKIKRRHSGQYLCSDCFINSIEKIISKTISKYGRIEPEDKIYLFLSATKNSIVLLYNLKKIIDNAYKPNQIVVFIIEKGNYVKEIINLCKLSLNL